MSILGLYALLCGIVFVTVNGGVVLVDAMLCGDVCCFMLSRVFNSKIPLKEALQAL